MKDIRTGILIAVPAAVVLLSIIWFLRKKSNKKDRPGKDSGISPQPVRDCDKPEVQVPAHPSHRKNQGITLTQRKIPEAPAGEPRDSGQLSVQPPKLSSELSRSSSRSVREASDSGLEPETESSFSKHEDTLTSSEKVRVQELVQSAIGVGILEASQCLPDSVSDAVLDEAHGDHNKTPELTENLVQESMIVSATAPTYLSPPSQSSSLVCCSGNGDNHNDSCSETPSLRASLFPTPSKTDSKGIGVDNEGLAYRRDDDLITMDIMSSSTSVPNFSSSQSTSCISQQDSSSNNDHHLSHPSSHQGTAPMDPVSSPTKQDSLDERASSLVTSIDHLFPMEYKELNVSSSTEANTGGTTDTGDILSQSGCSHLDSKKDIFEKSSTAYENSSNQQFEEPSANSISPVCDSNSVGSNDSGRGGSEQDSTTQVNENFIHFDFNMPSELCGRLIGRQGKNINFIKTKSGASVSLTNNPFTPEFQICQVIGSQAEVDEALALIRHKFPLHNHPGLTMAHLNLPIPSQIDSQPVIVPEGVQLSLPEGVSVDVYVSAIVNAGHVFVQQPTHRTFMSLEKLNFFLNSLYGQDPSIPSVPEPMECGVICVCENEGAWYRAMITSPVDENSECQVKFVDYGGYAHLSVSSLKQIRTDFMSLPFQAVECFMANISPISGENFFSDLATLSLSEKTQLKLLKCQVVARSEDGTPFIHLYDVDPNATTAVMLNRTLVGDGLVQWVEIL